MTMNNVKTVRESRIYPFSIQEGLGAFALFIVLVSLLNKQKHQSNRQNTNNTEVFSAGRLCLIVNT